MEYKPRTVKLWSKAGQRATFGLMMMELRERYQDLMVLSADVSTSAGLNRFKEVYPDSYLDMGISEQNMMGVATGLSSEGYQVVTTTFAPFQTMRCLEQIRVNQGYMGQKVIMVGLASGVVLGTLGNTHCCIEDIGVLRSIPNLKIVVPGDCFELAKALEASLKEEKSVYIRLSGGSRQAQIYSEDYHFEIGQAVWMIRRQEADISIIANGTMVKESIEAAKILGEKGIKVQVLNMHTIKPIDRKAIREASIAPLLVTVEEHNVYGGLFSSVSEVLAEEALGKRVLPIGIMDTYPKPYTYQESLEHLGLTRKEIAKKIEGSLKDVGFIT